MRRKGLHDELRGDQYAVVETSRGQAHYVRLDSGTAESLREGSVVRVEITPEAWAKKTDLVLAQVAAEGNGVYDPRSHLKQMSASPPVIAGKVAEPSAVLQANLRRLERLERYRLVSRLHDGTWLVPPNLLEVLAKREQSHPKVRTRIKVLAGDPDQAVRYPGPTWLERQRGDQDTRAPYGFGAQMARALRGRADFLAELGVRGTPSEVSRTLRRIEAKALGMRVAAKTGHALVEKPESGFRGRLFACEQTPSGQTFVRIVDETGRRFVLLRTNDATKALDGAQVELTRDSKGRLVPRPTGLTRGE